MGIFSEILNFIYTFVCFYLFLLALQPIIISRNQMLANLSEPCKNKSYNIKPCHTPVKQRQKDPSTCRSHKSFIKEHQQKINMMLDMNKKFEQELINNEFLKMRELEKYSPKKIYRIQKQKPSENLSPIKVNKLSSQKERLCNKNQTTDVNNRSFEQQSFTLFGRKCTQKRIIENQSCLPEVPQDEIRISKYIEDSWTENSNEPLMGYWIPYNKIVSLFPVNNRKIDKVPVINQPYILPMLGCLSVKSDQKRSEKYIITELYSSNSLRDVMNEFSNIDQATVKTYLRKIIICVWNLHKNRIAHNRLTLDAFISNQNGGLLLNMLKSSVKPLTEQQKYQQAHDFPPEMLLSRTNYDSMKNDIWAIGCMTLELLTNQKPKRSIYHPYNKAIEPEIIDSPIKLTKVQSQYKDKNIKLLSSFESSRVSSQFKMMNDSHSILQKVKRLIENDTTVNTPHESLISIELCESIMLREISPLASDFSQKCLNLKLQKRPSIDELMFHPFLK